MSSLNDRHEPLSPGWEVTPGLHITRESPPSHSSYGHLENDEPPSRLGSLDLASARSPHDTYDNWTEMSEMQ
jgi:hypothetical protein